MPDERKQGAGIAGSIAAYLTAGGLVAAATAVPHAILTPLLLSKGLTLSDIAFIQAVYSAVVLVTEYPSGVLADRLPRRRLFVVSKVLLIGFFIMVIACSGLTWLTVAWALYGVSSALDSGTIDSDLTVHLRRRLGDGAPTALSRLTRWSSQTNFAAMLIASAVGSLAYFVIGFSAYWISVGLTVLAVVTVLLWFRVPDGRVHGHSAAHGAASFGPCPAVQGKTPTTSSTGGPATPGWVTTTMRSVRSQVLDGWRELRSSVALRRFISLAIVGQVFFQAHFQFWQAFSLAKGLPETSLPVLYILFQVIGIVAGFVPVHTMRARPSRQGIAFLHALIVALAISLVAASGIWSFVPYFFFVAGFSVLLNFCTYSLRRFISEENMSAMTSFSSSASRLGAIAALSASALFLRFGDPVTLQAVLFGLASVLVVWLLLARPPAPTSRRRTNP